MSKEPRSRERKKRKTITATTTLRYPEKVLFPLGATSVDKRLIRKAVRGVVNKMKETK